jgi:hypothetical protein
MDIVLYHAIVSNNSDFIINICERCTYVVRHGSSLLGVSEILLIC